MAEPNTLITTKKSQFIRKIITNIYNVIMNNLTANVLTTFEYEGNVLSVSFISTLDVANGVQCDTYQFIGDKTKDLGIIRIKAGCKTPLQRVLKGERTIEGYISGAGKLVITKPNGEQSYYKVDNNSKKHLMITVEIGDLMQWSADENSELEAFEICYPPYEDGRYENIPSVD